MNVSVILLAGGVGARLGTPIPKQFLPLGEQIVALHSFSLFLSLPCVQEIIVVAQENYHSLFPQHAKVHFAQPGTRRQDSLFAGLEQVSPHCDLVCIHDAARPFVTLDAVERVLTAAQTHGAAALAIPVRDTIKKVDPAHFVQTTLDRSSLWQMHTPQVATPQLLRQGFAFAQTQTLTDDSALIELTRYPVKLVEDSPLNFKITTQEDLLLAQAWHHANSK